MTPKNHVLVSATLGGVLFYVTQSLSPGVACFLAGTVIDIDHLYDYLKHCGLKFSIKNFFSGDYFVESRRNFVWLHSYELLPFILVSVLLSP